MIIGLFSFSLKGVTTYADSIGLAPGEDPSIYNTEWTQANVKDRKSTRLNSSH